MVPLRIALAVPERPSDTSGNSVTGERWARRLGELGHDVRHVAVTEGRAGNVPTTQIDLLVALHATRCADEIDAFATAQPDVPIVVGLAGTDLYRDLPDDHRARRSLDRAHHLVVLQSHGLARLSEIHPSYAAKASVVHQSVEHADRPARRPAGDGLTVVVLAHLRSVKDPLLTAQAVRRLDVGTRVRVEHAGAAHSTEWALRADAEMRENDRYVWHGPLPRAQARQLLGRADVIACTSRLEGGANVVSEAIATGIAVIGTDIGGNRGLLGEDHPGLVPVGDVERLTDLLRRIEDPDRDALADLEQRSRGRAWMVEPDHERDQWSAVVRAALR